MHARRKSLLLTVSLILALLVLAPAGFDRARAASTPFQLRADVDIFPGESNAIVTIFTVPAGKRLVIEFFSALGEAPGSQKVVFELRATFGGDQQEFLFPAIAQGNFGGFATYTAAEKTLIYADPGTNVKFAFFRNSFNSKATSTISITGHLEDVP